MVATTFLRCLAVAATGGTALVVGHTGNDPDRLVEIPTNTPSEVPSTMSEWPAHRLTPNPFAVENASSIGYAAAGYFRNPDHGIFPVYRGDRSHLIATWRPRMRSGSVFMIADDTCTSATDLPINSAQDTSAYRNSVLEHSATCLRLTSQPTLQKLTYSSYARCTEPGIPARSLESRLCGDSRYHTPIPMPVEDLVSTTIDSASAQRLMELMIKALEQIQKQDTLRDGNLHQPVIPN